MVGFGLASLAREAKPLVIRIFHFSLCERPKVSLRTCGARSSLSTRSDTFGDARERSRLHKRSLAEREARFSLRECERSERCERSMRSKRKPLLPPKVDKGQTKGFHRDQSFLHKATPSLASPKVMQHRILGEAKGERRLSCQIFSLFKTFYG